MLIGAERSVAAAMQVLAGASVIDLPALPDSGPGRDLDQGSGVRTHVQGSFQGANVHITFSERHGRGVSGGFKHPTIFVVPGAHGLFLELERRNKFGTTGHMSKVELIHFPDPSFESLFWVEGAPQAVVRGILTDAVRARLVHHHVDALRVDMRGTRIAFQGWPEDPQVVRSLIETLVIVASSIAPGSGALAQHPEVIALIAERQRRSAADTRLFIVIVVAILLVTTIIVAFVIWLSSTR